MQAGGLSCFTFPHAGRGTETSYLPICRLAELFYLPICRLIWKTSHKVLYRNSVTSKCTRIRSPPSSRHLEFLLHTIRSPPSSRHLEIFTTFPGLVIFLPNTDSVTSKFGNLEFFTEYEFGHLQVGSNRKNESKLNL